MKRGIIIIEDKKVSVTGNEVWMTATEIAGLFHAGVPAVNAAIKAVRKSDVLNDYEVCRYMRLEKMCIRDSLRTGRFSSIAASCSRRNNRVRPQRSGNASEKHPNISFPGCVYCCPG